MTCRQLAYYILGNIYNLDSTANVRIIRRDSENCFIGAKTVPIARVTSTDVIIEEKDLLKVLDWSDC